MFPLFNFSHAEQFVAGESCLESLLRHPIRLNGGMLIFCLSGEAIVEINMEQHRVTAGTEIVLLNSSSVFSLEKSDEKFNALYITLSPEMLDTVGHRLPVLFFDYLQRYPCHRHAHDSCDNIEILFRYIISLSDDKENKYRNVIMENCIRAYFWSMSDKIDRCLSVDAMPSNYWQKQFRQYISLILNPGNKHRDIKYYADAMCITPRRLAVITRQAIAKTPKEILDEFFIQEIKILLNSTDKTVGEIAEMIGFPDQSYLGRYFKRHTGISPARYRNLPDIYER